MFTNGVGVVLAGTLAEPVGMSIAWLTRVEREHVVLSLPEGARGTARILSDGRFTLSLLADSQEDVARWFGRSERTSARREPPALVETAWGVVAVEGSLAVYLCTVVGMQGLGGQTVVTARTEGPVQVEQGRPLVYRASDYS